MAKWAHEKAVSASETAFFIVRTHNCTHQKDFIAATHEKIERRTFGGGGAMNGFAGFWVSQSYQLRCTMLESGNVSLKLDHAREGVRPLVLPYTQFKAWFDKG